MGNCLFLRTRGVGNRPPSENKIANSRGYTRRGMVTGRIEPYIMRESGHVYGIICPQESNEDTSSK